MTEKQSKIALEAVQRNVSQIITNGDDTDNDKNNHHTNNQPLSHITKVNEVAYLEMREAAEQCYLLLDRQRQALCGYGELAEKHHELRQQFEAINLENQMWRLDLERERWTHRQYISNIMKNNMTKSDTLFDEEVADADLFSKKQCFARAS